MAKNATTKEAMAERLMKLRRIAEFQGIWYENTEMKALAREIQADVEKEVLALVAEYEVAGTGEITRVLEERLLSRLAERYRHIIGDAIRDLMDMGELKLGKNWRLRLNPKKEKPDE